MLYECIVIGRGIMGTTIARALRLQGKEVLIIDRDEPMAGTIPSGGHLKPEWFSKMPSSEYMPAMRLLEEAWGGLISEKFEIRAPIIGTKVATTTVYRVDTDLVRADSYTKGNVTEITHLDNYPLLHTETDTYRCKLLIVAAGIWCSQLIEGVVPTPKQGVSFLVTGRVGEPFIQPWAPYKQIVAHQQSTNNIWIGDGTTVLPKNWDQARTEKCFYRCMRSLGRDKVANRFKIQYGLRPYLKPLQKTDPCYLHKLYPHVWVATGAGKLGTIAAGWAARRIIDAI